MNEMRRLDLQTLPGTVTVSVQTDPGCIRDSNEDSGRHVIPNDPETAATKGTLTIVADGMGGHASGEIASKLAVDLVSEFYYANNRLSPGESLKEAIEMANEAIYLEATTDEQCFGMGTTVIALAICGDTAYHAHVGDSRLYRTRGGKLEMLTTDHSQVMEMVKHGIISMEEARTHDDKNVILRAVGTQATVEVEVSPPVEVRPGDTFLLCSDGLNDMVEDEEIEEILSAGPDIHSACELLIQAAKLNGGHDNITAGIIRVGDAEPQQSVAAIRVTREVEAVN